MGFKSPKSMLCGNDISPPRPVSFASSPAPLVPDTLSISPSGAYPWPRKAFSHGEVRFDSYLAKQAGDRQRPFWRRHIWELLVFILVGMGLVHIPNDYLDNAFHRPIRWSDTAVWDSNRQAVIHNATPVNVHSHNDYTRRIPLFEALGSGCIGVEADVHLVDSDLLVGHSSRHLRRRSNLKSMYLSPLERMIDAQQQRSDSTQPFRNSWRGMFNASPKQTIVLLIDHKTSGPETFAELARQLDPLRGKDYLTYWNGTERIMRPLTVVATGKAPFEGILNLSSTHRDIFFDAPLTSLASPEDNFTNPASPIYKYNRSNSYWASGAWKHAKIDTTYPPSGSQTLSVQARDQSKGTSQLELAASRGLLARYWDVPSGPSNLLTEIWRVLIKHNIGIINMDDMAAVRDRAFAWGSVHNVSDAVY